MYLPVHIIICHIVVPSMTFLKARVLQELKDKGIQHVPTVLSTASVGDGRTYTVMQPFGRLLEGSDSPMMVVQAILDAANAIQGASKIGILHRDISLGNLITHEGRCVKGHSAATLSS